MSNKKPLQKHAQKQGEKRSRSPSPEKQKQIKQLTSEYYNNLDDIALIKSLSKFNRQLDNQKDPKTRNVNLNEAITQQAQSLAEDAFIERFTPLKNDDLQQIKRNSEKKLVKMHELMNKIQHTKPGIEEDRKKHTRVVQSVERMQAAINAKSTSAVKKVEQPQPPSKKQRDTIPIHPDTWSEVTPFQFRDIPDDQNPTSKTRKGGHRKTIKKRTKEKIKKVKI